MQPKRPKPRPRPRQIGGELVPPHDHASERAVLAAVLFDPAALLDIRATIRDPQAFFRPAHATIFGAMCDLFDRGEPIDLVTLTDLLDKREELRAAGGTDYLIELSGTVGTSANALHHARIVANYATLRGFIAAAQSAITEAYSRPENLDDFLTEATGRILDIIGAGAKQSRVVSLDEAMYEALCESIEQLQGKAVPRVPLFLDKLNQVTNGGIRLKQAGLVIAAPGTGKSLFKKHSAFAAANAGHVVGVIELEDEPAVLGVRAVSDLYDWPTAVVENPTEAKKRGSSVTVEHLAMLRDAARADHRDTPILIAECIGYRWEQVELEMRRMNTLARRRFGKPVSFWLIDHIHQLPNDGKYRSMMLAEMFRGVGISLASWLTHTNSAALIFGQPLAEKTRPQGKQGAKQTPVTAWDGDSLTAFLRFIRLGMSLHSPWQTMSDNERHANPHKQGFVDLGIDKLNSGRSLVRRIPLQIDHKTGRMTERPHVPSRNEEQP